MKAIEQYFPVVLFIMLYKVVLSFESVDEILKCDHSNESHCVIKLYSTFLTWHCSCATIPMKDVERHPSNAKKIFSSFLSFCFVF